MRRTRAGSTWLRRASAVSDVRCAARDRRERVAGLHDVHARPRRRASRRPDHPHGDARAAERGERPRPADPVGGESRQPLEATESAKRRPVEIAVHRHVHPVPDEQELQHGDVPAERAAAELPRTEEMPAERAELLSRARIGHAGHAQVVRALERANRGDRARSDDPVDRPRVETLCPQRDLETCGLRVARQCRPGGDQAGSERAEDDDPDAHRTVRIPGRAGDSFVIGR